MAHTPETTPALHGVMAEYESGQALVDAARKTVAQRFTRVEAYSPVPIEDLNTIIHKTRTVLPKLVLAGGLTGMATGFALQYWASGMEYPLNNRRPPDGELDHVYRAVVRADDSVCLADGGHRHGAPERPAAAVSPGV